MNYSQDSSANQMSRDEVADLLRTYIGEPLQPIAENLQVTVEKHDGSVNKGWAGHTVEKLAGMQLNSTQAPDGGDWELKVVPVKKLVDGRLTFKETMAVTMLDPEEVRLTPFYESHLYRKLRRMLFVVREVGDAWQVPSHIRSVHEIDIDDYPLMLRQVARDYSEVQDCLNDPGRGFQALSGNMGYYIQPRTKGEGHGSTSRAFYARKIFLVDLGLLARTR